MKILIMILSVFMFCNVAKAGISGGFIEPMITYENGNGYVNFPSPYEDSDVNLKGFGAGLRIGAHVMDTVFIAADGRYSWVNFKEDRIGQDADAKAWNVGPIIGIQMPTTIGLRIWAGWIVAGEVDPKESKNVKERFESGQGYRVGAGVKLATVSLNIEYQKIKYDSTRIQDVGVFAPNTSRDDIEYDNDSMVLSLSFPIGL